MKKIAYKFKVIANWEDLMTASDLWLRSNSNPERVNEVLEEHLRDLRNWEVNAYYTKWYIIDDDILSFEPIK